MKLAAIALLIWPTFCFAQNRFLVFHAGSGNPSTELNVYLGGTLQPVAQLTNVPPGVFQILSTPDGGKVYLAADGSGAALTVLDANFQNPRTVPSTLTAKPVYAAFQPDGRRLIVAAGRIYFVDTATDVVLNPNGLAVDGVPFDVAVNYDSTRAFVLSRRVNAGFDNSVVTSIDLTTFTVLGTAGFPGNQTETATGIVFAPNGRLYVSSYARVYELDAATLQDTPGGEFLIRGHPEKGVMTPAGRYLVFRNKQPRFGGNSIIQLDLATRTVGYDAASSDETFASLVPTSIDDDNPAMYAYANSGRLFDLTPGSPLILDRAAINARFQTGNPLPTFSRLAFSNEVPPNRMWFTQSNPSRIVQAGLTPSDQTIQETALSLPQDRKLSVAGAASVSGGTLLLRYNADQTVSPGARAALPLSVRLIDSSGRPIFRGAVTFTSSSPEAILQTPQVITGIEGYAQTIITAPRTPGIHTIRATAGPGVTPTSFRIAVPSQQGLSILSGNQQRNRENVPVTLSVLRSDLGEPISGQRISWTVLTPGAGTLSAEQTVTDAGGVAQNVFRGSSYIGPLLVKASVDNLSVVFELENVATLIGAFGFVGGASQQAEPGNEFAGPLTVSVRDPRGRPLSDVRVNFSATGGVFLSGESVLTNQIGEASVRARAGGVLGSFVVTAEAGRASAALRLEVVSPVGMRYVPVPPCRVLDTRIQGGAVPADGTLRINPRVNNGCAALPPDVAAYALNVTVIPRGPLSFITLWPAGFPQPLVSTLNSVDGRIKANAAIVRAGSVDNGAVDLYATDTTDIAVDLNGYFVPPSSQGTDRLLFYPLTPCRLLDTRTGSNQLTARETRNFTLSGCIAPQVPVGAVSLNATVIPRNAAPFGFLTLWPDGIAQPAVSTLNALTGTVTANAALLQVPSNGTLKMFGTDAADVVMDTSGFFGPPSIAAIPGGGMHFYPITPCRISDTRLATGPLGGPALTAAVPRTIPVPRSACGIPETAAAYVLNATVVPNGVFGFLTLWPSGLPQPLASTLNAVDGFVTSNMSIVRTGSNGSIDLFGSNNAHVLFDISGYFAP